MVVPVDHEHIASKVSFEHEAPDLVHASMNEVSSVGSVVLIVAVCHHLLQQRSNNNIEAFLYIQ